MISTYLTGDVTVGLVWSIMAGVTANYVYYWHCREHITAIKKSTGADPAKQDEVLKESGGVQSYVIWIGVVLYILFAITMVKMVQDGPPDGERLPGKPANPTATSSA
jgi:H+/gluconate symporter-like permease